MKNIFYILLFSVLLFACHSNTIYQKPAHLIPEEKMIDLLADMQIAVAAKGIKNKYHQHRINYMHLVFEKYGIDSLQFQESNLYYTSRIDDYEKLLRKVHAKLRNQKNKIEKENKINDSIKQAKKGLKKKTVIDSVNIIPTNLFLYSEPTFKEGPERNIKYENFNWRPLKFNNCTLFHFQNNKLPFRYSGAVSPNKKYTISAYLKMKDLSKPIIGGKVSKGDFSFIISGKIAAKNIKVTSLGNHIYRCSATGYSKKNSNTFNGIVSYPKQSHKNFRVVGWQLEEGNKVGPYIPSK